MLGITIFLVIPIGMAFYGIHPLGSDRPASALDRIENFTEMFTDDPYYLVSGITVIYGRMTLIPFMIIGLSLSCCSIISCEDEPVPDDILRACRGSGFRDVGGSAYWTQTGR
jgi:hypothetical protein